jgi:hypothetical protein
VSLREKGPVSQQISPNHADGKGWLNRMLEALGTPSTDFVVTKLNRIMNAVGASGEGGEAKANAVLAVIDGIRPKNEVEAMLASQMVVTRHLAMELLGRARRVQDIEQFDWAVNAASKLLRTYVLQIEALANLRRGGKQEVRVVHVHAGAQAIIGDITAHQKGRGSKKNAHQPHVQAVARTCRLAEEPGRARAARASSQRRRKRDAGYTAAHRVAGHRRDHATATIATASAPRKRSQSGERCGNGSRSRVVSLRKPTRRTRRVPDIGVPPLACAGRLTT